MKKNVTDSGKTNLITAVVADRNGKIFELEGYAAVGMAADNFTALSTGSTINMPYGGEFMLLPDRSPVLFNLETKRLETLKENPYSPGEPVFPVAAFNSPGYVISHVSAYREKKAAKHLPLFSYGAVGWHRNGFRTAVILVDSEKRQDLRLMPLEKIIAGARAMKKKMPHNRLRDHIENCALKYGCPAAKNFFLGRYEAPLPTSKNCNARCIGCISLQTDSEIRNSQERISFTPSPEEISEIALEHIRKVKRSVVSFGQGCEGDPLLAAHVIEPAIKLIRSETGGGTINMNTNGSLPQTMERLFDAGLDSIRVSMNSVRKECYDAYFRPRSYLFSDVIKSVDKALDRKIFVSINYLNCPGFTDSAEEQEALFSFLKNHPVDFIQWRNLNFDPLRYWKIMSGVTSMSAPVGITELLSMIRKEFPDTRHGYFNPPKERF
ncbi:MAG: radical SAM protein [Desulfobacteraceae bacterium]|nr:MAG: radical SAM protein [Desulfobacteraceae bacterium]